MIALGVLLHLLLNSSLIHAFQNTRSSHKHTTKASQWMHVSQSGEMDFWMSHWDAMVSSAGKVEWSAHYKDYFAKNGGFNVDLDFVNKTVVDIGSGPRPLSFAMKGAHIVAVEPLADKFLKECANRIPDGSADYLELQKVDRIFSVPAESYIPEIAAAADVVLSTNSLDHTWDPTKYLSNMGAYMKPDGFILLVVDLHIKTDALHPQRLLFPDLVSYVYRAGLRFERGSCSGEAAHPALAFTSCWMVLKKNNDYV